MAITSTSAKEIAMLGGNIEITPDAGYTSTSVMEIIRIVTGKGNRVTVHAAPYTSTSLKEMVRLGGELVTIKV